MADRELIDILKQGVKAWNCWRAENPALLIDFRGANLRAEILFGYNLSGAILTKADLSRAVLTNADLSYTNLEGANLSRANLIRADLKGACLKCSNFSKAEMGWTTISNSDLSEVKGLEGVYHSGPSSIGLDTIYESKGCIPRLFLREAGVPDIFIEYMTSLTSKAFEFYSCFISYSSRDQDFAERLHADLQDKGVRCWFASEHLKIGEKIRIGIDESIKKHDKLLLVLSKKSVASDWVEQEVETALARERDEKRLVLFPIRLDDTVMRINTGWPAYIRNTRHMGDFRRWKNHDTYKKSFEKLLQDLKSEPSKENSA